MLQDNKNPEITDYGVLSDVDAPLQVENLHTEEERKNRNKADLGSQRNIFEEIRKTEKR